MRKRKVPVSAQRRPTQRSNVTPGPHAPYWSLSDIVFWGIGMAGLMATLYALVLHGFLRAFAAGVITDVPRQLGIAATKIRRWIACVLEIPGVGTARPPEPRLKCGRGCGVSLPDARGAGNSPYARSGRQPSSRYRRGTDVKRGRPPGGKCCAAGAAALRLAASWRRAFHRGRGPPREEHATQSVARPSGPRCRAVGAASTRGDQVRLSVEVELPTCPGPGHMRLTPLACFGS